MPDYLLPEGASLAAAGAELATRLKAREREAHSSDRFYYDTFDGLLYAAGLVAVWEDGQLALVERDGTRVKATLRIDKPNGRLFARDLGQGPLSDALQALIDVRALLPLVEIHSEEQALDVLDGERKTVVRIRLEQPAVGGRKLAMRVRVAPVRGYDKALRRVGETLSAELGLAPAERSVLDEAVAASGRRPGGTPSKIDVALERDQRADAAAAAVLQALLAVIRANLEGAVRDIDSEFLHDLRVSVRRSRAVQRELRGVFPPAELERYRTEFRWLQQATGDARDLDVYVLEFDAMRARVPEPIRPDLDSLLTVLRRHRAGAHSRMVLALHSGRTATLLADWSSFLESLERLPVDDRPDAAAPIAGVAGTRIAKVYRQMVRMGSAIGPESPATDYHELRKKGKELRYLLELFGAPLYPEDVVRPMIKTLKGLQDVLGCHQDRVVQMATLRALSEEVAATPDGPAALMAMGVLIEHLDADEHAARAAFAERFAEFASPVQRRLVKDTFA